MKTTVKHVGSVREWEGSMMSWHRHCDLIPKWCDGEDVEYQVTADKWSSNISWTADFHEDVNFRIKQREPKPGEVWIDSEGDALHIPFDCERWQFIDRLGYKNHNHPMIDIKYNAPSLEAYYARKFLNDCSDTLHSIVTQSAQLEK